MAGTSNRSSSRWRKIAANLRAQRNPCHICKQPIDYDAPPHHPDSFEADHYYPESTHPNLATDPANVRASHSKCNRNRGNQPMQPTRWVQAEEW